jgi:hypothetical protein
MIFVLAGLLTVPVVSQRRVPVERPLHNMAFVSFSPMS